MGVTTFSISAIGSLGIKKMLNSAEKAAAKKFK